MATLQFAPTQIEHTHRSPTRDLLSQSCDFKHYKAHLLEKYMDSTSSALIGLIRCWVLLCTGVACVR